MKQLREAFRNAYERDGYSVSGAACMRTRKHATEDDAYERLRHLLVENEAHHTPKKSVGLNVYRCRRCGFYHVGRRVSPLPIAGPPL